MSGTSATAEAENGGGYDLSFTDPPDDLLCMICHHVAKEAHQVECCGKVFCETCIKKAKERIGSCPNCRAESSKFKIFCDRMSGRRIKHLKLSCENEDRGCDWSGIFEEYDAHVTECGFVVVDCPNDGCTDKLLKKFLHEHLSLACRRRLVQCPVCKDKVVHEEMQTHPFSCPEVEIKCTNLDCSTKVYRRQLAAHRNVCPKTRIRCPYGELGCFERVHRKDIQKHLRENMDQHFSDALSLAKSLREKVASVRKEIELRSSPPYTFKMTGYKEMKRNRQEWTSPDFYSQPGGYKMRMIVSPGGTDGVSHRHLAVFISIIRGPKDAELVWPFMGTITVQILNQTRDQEHCLRSVVVVSTRGVKDGEEPRKEDGVNGSSRFIAHNMLEKETSTCTYINSDGCIYFRILKVEAMSVCSPWLICFPS